jgi:MFS family permease
MGRLGDLSGHPRVYTVGLALTTLAGLLCGLTSHFGPLLLARGLQGFGSAMVLGTSLAIVAAAVPARSRGWAIGLYTMASSGSSILGVWLSTWSVQHLTWEWAFLVAVPIGILATLAGLKLPTTPKPERAGPIDWYGAIVLFGLLTAGMLALNHLHEGGETFEAGGPYHVAMHLVTLAFLVAFIRVERAARAPLLSFALMRRPRFSAGILGNGIVHMNMLSTAFLVPFLLERGRGLTPAETGLLFIIQQLFTVGSSMLMGLLYDRTRSGWIAPVSLACIPIGLLLLSLLAAQLPYLGVLALCCLLGLGMGGFSTVNNTEIMSMAPNDQRGFASGLIETTRQFGHAVGVSLSGSFMAAAVAAGSLAAPSDYVTGFVDSTRAMGLIALLGLGTLFWSAGKRVVRTERAA